MLFPPAWLLPALCRSAQHSAVFPIPSVRRDSSASSTVSHAAIVLEQIECFISEVKPPGQFSFDNSGLKMMEYALGAKAEGTLGFAKVELGGCTVEHQAYNNVTRVEAPFDQLAGIGIEVSWALPPMDNFITISFARIEDLEASAQGSQTINTIAEGYEAVYDSPAISVHPTDSVYWSIIIDGISVDGVNVTTPSRFAYIPSGENYGSFFHDATLDGIHSKIPGAEKKETPARGTAWTIPCNTTSIVAIHIGYLSPMPVQGYKADAMLGQDILCNVYSVYNYGNLSAGNTSVQLVTQTDPKEAMAEVLRVRMPRLTTYADGVSGAISAVAANDPEPSTSRTTELKGTIIIALVGANLVVALILVVLALAFCVKRGGKSLRREPKYSRAGRSAGEESQSLNSYEDRRYSD
ncbi:hypothetical protein C8R43DRAFT_1110343 [Mycena crocata]|nr:hypothetical protein C8R43DRAFT_1110343 [Mycena crocata]